MPFKDLTSFLAPNLELPWREHVFVVPPPSRETGLVLAALSTQAITANIAAVEACPTCHRSGEIEVDDRQKSLLESAREKDLGELSLGSAYQEMVDAGIPAPDLELFELYAFYYWVYGESAADSWLSDHQSKKFGGPVPKDHLPRKNGRSTGSASQSGTTKTESRSTLTTGSQKK